MLIFLGSGCFRVMNEALVDRDIASDAGVAILRQCWIPIDIMVLKHLDNIVSDRIVAHFADECSRRFDVFPFVGIRVLDALGVPNRISCDRMCLATESHRTKKQSEPTEAKHSVTLAGHSLLLYPANLHAQKSRVHLAM